MYLCLIKLIGEENDEYYRYDFIFSEKLADVEFIEEDYEPLCLTKNFDISDNNELEHHTVKMKIKLDLIQDNCCFSFLHCKARIVSLGWENIDEYDSYPEEGRLYFMFGETLDEVEEKLAVKRILMIN